MRTKQTCGYKRYHSLIADYFLVENREKFTRKKDQSHKESLHWKSFFVKVNQLHCIGGSWKVLWRSYCSNSHMPERILFDPQVNQKINLFYVINCAQEKLQLDLFCSGIANHPNYEPKCCSLFIRFHLPQPSRLQLWDKVVHFHICIF